MVTLSSSNHQQLPRQDLTQHHIQPSSAMKTWNDLQFYLCLSSAAHHASVVARICESCPGNVQTALGSACKQISSHAETNLIWQIWQIQIHWNKSMTNTNTLKQKYDKYKYAETKVWQLQLRWNKVMTDTNTLKQKKYDKFKYADKNMKDTSGNTNDMMKWCSMWKLFKGQCFCVSTRWCTRCCNQCTMWSRKSIRCCTRCTRWCS